MVSEKESAFIGVFVSEFSSESIHEALKNRSIYIASDKIFLDARILDRPMGAEFKTKETIPRIDITVMGTDEIYQIDIFSASIYRFDI